MLAYEGGTYEGFMLREHYRSSWPTWALRLPRKLAKVTEPSVRASPRLPRSHHLRWR